MIEVTKDPIHPVVKNGEHLIKSNQHMDILHAFINYVRATFNHGLSPSEVDGGNPKGELTEMLKYASNGCMLIKVDWGGNLIHTSCGCMLIEVDWETNSYSTLWLTGKRMKLTPMDTTSLRLTGRPWFQFQPYD